MPVTVEYLDFHTTMYFLSHLTFPFFTQKRIIFSTCEHCCCSKLENRMLKAFCWYLLRRLMLQSQRELQCHANTPSLAWYLQMLQSSLFRSLYYSTHSLMGFIISWCTLLLLQLIYGACIYLATLCPCHKIAAVGKDL